jgi:hypothetical protein
MSEFSFNPTEATRLCEIMGRNKSDKGSVDITNSHHNYSTVYYSLFKDIAEKNMRVFELGLGTNNVNVPSNMGKDGRPGASLYGWSEFFPNSQIFGADIDRGVLFNTERIKTFFCDQTRPESIHEMWNESELHENFDIIIEDGLHTFDANVCFFENSIHKLKKNGYFIIEDVLTSTERIVQQKLSEWRRVYTDCTFTFLKVPSTRNHIDNNLIIIYKSA